MSKQPRNDTFLGSVRPSTIRLPFTESDTIASHNATTSDNEECEEVFHFDSAPSTCPAKAPPTHKHLSSLAPGPSSQRRTSALAFPKLSSLRPVLFVDDDVVGPDTDARSTTSASSHEDPLGIGRARLNSRRMSSSITSEEDNSNDNSHPGRKPQARPQILRATFGNTGATTPRDMPSEIIPGFLFLGSQRAANSKDRMAEYGITRYLCCAAEAPLPRHVEPERFQSGDVEIKHIPMRDGAKTQLQEHFNEAFAFIRAAKRARRRVLVYCREGKSRSASIIIAYFIRYMAMSYEEALAAVRTKRSVVDPNFSFCNQLDDYSAYRRQDTASPVSEASRPQWSEPQSPLVEIRSGGSYDSLHDGIGCSAMASARGSRHLALELPFSANQGGGGGDDDNVNIGPYHRYHPLELEAMEDAKLDDSIDVSGLLSPDTTQRLAMHGRRGSM